MSQLLITTDLDGTLLDHHTYSAVAAESAMEALKRLRIPCILNTSKTFVELEKLRPTLNHQDPFIVENGAAVYIPKMGHLDTDEALDDFGDYWRKSFGPSRAYIIEAIGEVCHNYRFKGFSDMTTEEVAKLTGLTLEDSRLAMRRQFTEPLVWNDSPEAMQAFAVALAGKNLQIQRGGRFAHVMGLTDKAQAMHWVAALYSRRYGEKVTTMALGDGQNDVGMLSEADIAVVVRSPAHPPPEVPGRTDVWFTEHCGPQGWAEAIHKALPRFGHRLFCNR